MPPAPMDDCVGDEVGKAVCIGDLEERYADESEVTEVNPTAATGTTTPPRAPYNPGALGALVTALAAAARR